MKATETEPIDDLIAQLEAQISVSERLGLGLTKLLLSMARLDLQMRRHNIRSAELSRLCAHYERNLARNSPAGRSSSGGPKAKLPVRAVEPIDSREPSAGNGARSARAASAQSGRPPQTDVSFGRRYTGSRKARRR
jgi:hypothetical protein